MLKAASSFSSMNGNTGSRYVPVTSMQSYIIESREVEQVNI